jgi:Flp pilus assembly protein TadD/TolB-like protein
MLRRYFRNAHVALFGLLCAMAVAGAASTARAVPQEIHKAIVLVFPFDNGSGNASLEWLGEGLGEITVERLEDRRLSVLSRQERLSTLEKMGLPATAEFSHATMIKVAAEADADEVVFGQYFSDGKNITLEARVLRISPPGLSRKFTQTGALRDVLRTHARLAWQVVCTIDKNQCPAADANLGETIFTEPPPSLTLDTFETFVKGLLASDDEPRLRDLREAARQEPAWDRPPFELGQVYFARGECESALPWYSRVPPDRPDGPEASFNTGVCLLLTPDLVRAEATFSALLARVRSQDGADHLPDLPEFHNNLGVAQLRQGKWAEAAAEFERAKSLDTEEPDYWVNLGLAGLAEKQPAAAVSSLQAAWKLDPGDDDVRTLLISTLESLGRNSEADAIRAAGGGARAVDPLPQDPFVLARRARVIMKFDRASLRSSPDSPPAGSPPKGSPDQRVGAGIQR